MKPLYDVEREIAIIWSIGDVRAVRSDLSDAQAMAVLKETKRTHDSNRGVYWETLTIIADNLYPENADRSGCDE